jgi:hypothetical protein
MKSIERRFQNAQKRNPGWSSYLSFTDAITGQKFSKETIQNWFNKLVEKLDYAQTEKKAILAHLEILTNTLRTPQNNPKLPL